MKLRCNYREEANKNFRLCENLEISSQPDSVLNRFYICMLRIIFSEGPWNLKTEKKPLSYMNLVNFDLSLGRRLDYIFL
jgi:hypothetical protein